MQLISKPNFGTSRIFLVGLVCPLFFTGSNTSAQSISADSLRIPRSSVPFLTFAPDARSAGMGEAGVALSPDANSAYWNASKLPFAEKDFGVSATYTPWLRNLTDGMWLGYASVYKKLGERQAVAVSVNYFSNKDVSLRLATGPITSYQSRDLVLNATYARQLGKDFSVGLTVKYISSRLDGISVVNNIPVKPGRTLAGDLSAYYRKQWIDEGTGRNLSWTLGAVLSNFGGKISNGSEDPDFLPTTLKVGGGFSFSPNHLHQFNLILDASKLMVPTPLAGRNVNTKETLSGIFGSFTDAPGGFREEMQEVTWSGGAEYKYKNTLALRVGYLGESRYKGDRKYFTAGAGIRILKSYDVDFAYIIPSNEGSPFKNMYRITLSAYLNTKRKAVEKNG